MSASLIGHSGSSAFRLSATTRDHRAHINNRHSDYRCRRCDLVLSCTEETLFPDPRLAKLLKLLVVLVCLGAILARLPPILGCGRLGAEFSFFFASWWPTAHPTAAPTKPWWPAKCPATPPTAAPLRQPLASAGMLVSAKATVNTAQLRVVFISIRASVLCFTIRAVSFRSAYDGWGDRTIPKVRSNCAIEELPAASPTRRRTWALVAGPC